jgi:hypothetical protein
MFIKRVKNISHATLVSHAVGVLACLGLFHERCSQNEWLK